jgi:hypothetical protein
MSMRLPGAVIVIEVDIDNGLAIAAIISSLSYLALAIASFS